MFSIFLGGFAILFNGIGGIMQGVEGQGISRWLRAPLVGVGILSIAISGLIITHPMGFWILTIRRRYVICNTDNWNGDNSYGSSR